MTQIPVILRLQLDDTRALIFDWDGHSLPPGTYFQFGWNKDDDIINACVIEHGVRFLRESVNAHVIELEITQASTTYLEKENPQAYERFLADAQAHGWKFE